MSIKKTLTYIAVLVALLVGVFALATPTMASITGPVSTSFQRPSTGSLVVPFFQAQTLVTSTRSTYFYSLGAYDRLDVQYVVAGNTATSTTLTTMFSNDGLNWVTGTVLLNNGVTAQTDMTQTWNFGRYTAIQATLNNTGVVTLTVMAVAK